MKNVLSCLLALAILPAAHAQDPRPAPITVLKDTSPVMYGRSAKVKAVVEVVDVEGRHLTFRGPRGRSVTMRVEARVKNLAELTAGDEVVVRYHESVGTKVRKAEEGETLPAADAVTVMEDGQAGSATPASANHAVIANVESAGAREKSLVLRDDEGRYYDLYVRDEKLLESLKAGDRVFANYTEATVVSIDGPKEKDPKDAKAKKKPRKK